MGMFTFVSGTLMHIHVRGFVTSKVLFIHSLEKGHKTSEGLHTHDLRKVKLRLNNHITSYITYKRSRTQILDGRIYLLIAISPLLNLWFTRIRIPHLDNFKFMHALFTQVSRVLKTAFPKKFKNPSQNMV